MEDNEFLLKMKNLPLDQVNQMAMDGLSYIEEICRKKVVINLKDGHFFEGIITGYDMFQVYLLREGEHEASKFLHDDIAKYRVLE